MCFATFPCGVLGQVWYLIVSIPDLCRLTYCDSLEYKTMNTSLLSICMGEFIIEKELLSCQPRETVTSCFVYKVIRDLESIDHLCINPIRRVGLSTSDLSSPVSSSGM